MLTGYLGPLLDPCRSSLCLSRKFVLPMDDEVNLMSMRNSIPTTAEEPKYDSIENTESERNLCKEFYEIDL